MREHSRELKDEVKMKQHTPPQHPKQQTPLSQCFHHDSLEIYEQSLES